MIMSINDLLADDTLIPTMLVLFVVIMVIAIPVGISMSKKTNSNIYGDDEIGLTQEEKNVKIIARRTTPHPLNQSVMINMVVFEFVNGRRIELAIKDPNIYGVMVEGDYGTLKYYGKKFISFQRGSNREI